MIGNVVDRVKLHMRLAFTSEVFQLIFGGEWEINLQES
jgi:hypothetical protein